MRDCKHWTGRCTLGLYGGKPSPGVCARCDRREPGPSIIPVRVEVPSVPPDQWPHRIRLLARLRAASDTGVGDTLARFIKAAGGEIAASWYEWLTGKSCGCSDRRAALNRRYPYEKPPDPPALQTAGS